MSRKIALRPEARADLATIWSYTADQWGEMQADGYVQSLEARIATAAVNPELGSDCSELYPELRRMKFGSHLIYYLANDELLDVVRILHGRRDAISLVSGTL